MTGLSGSGKSTLAYAIEKKLLERHVHARVLDGDNLRLGLNRDLGFDATSRTENIRRAAEVARLFVESGAICLISLISPLRADRARAREIIGANVAELFVSTPLTICEQRDPKGLYRRARAGDIPEFTGVSAPYEPPIAPSLSLDLSIMTIEESARDVLAFLEDRGVVRKRTLDFGSP